MKKAIFLFDYTGLMAKAWADAGYQCFIFDGQHEMGVTIDKGNPNILKVGMWFSTDPANDDVAKIIAITGTDIDLVFGFPECTQLAVSGAAHFAKKRGVNPNFQIEAMQLVHLVKNLGEALHAPWALENPVSVISSMWRKPNFAFHPYEYGGYLAADDVHPSYPEYIKPRDAYPKKTCIWSGNGFVEPRRIPVDCDPGYSD